MIISLSSFYHGHLIIKTTQVNLYKQEFISNLTEMQYLYNLSLLTNIKK